MKKYQIVIIITETQKQILEQLKEDIGVSTLRDLVRYLVLDFITKNQHKLREKEVSFDFNSFLKEFYYEKEVNPDILQISSIDFDEIIKTKIRKKEEKDKSLEKLREYLFSENENEEAILGGELE